MDGATWIPDWADGKTVIVTAEIGDWSHCQYSENPGLWKHAGKCSDDRDCRRLPVAR